MERHGGSKPQVWGLPGTGTRFPFINILGVPQEPGDASTAHAVPEGSLLGDLGGGVVLLCEKGLGGKGQTLFCAPSPLSGREMEAPARGPDSSALFMGRKGGKLWDSPPSANLSDGWVLGGEARQPSRNTLPLSWSRPQPSHGGQAPRGRTGLGTITALSWQLPAHTRTHA